MKETPIISELGQIQHKCSDICNCDRLLEEPKSNTQGLGLLLHIAARPSLDQGFLWLLVLWLCQRTWQRQAVSTSGCPHVSLVTVSVFQIQSYSISYHLSLLLKCNLDKTSNHTLFTKEREGVV